MDWQTLKAGMTDLADSDYPARCNNNRALRRVLNGELYDHIATPFSMERTEAGKYLPLDQRRPSVRHGWCATVVNDSVSMLFGQGRWPAIETTQDDEATLEALRDMIAATRLNETMMDAACRGSVGSVAVLMSVLQYRPFFDVIDTDFLTPVWKKDDPRTLESVTQKYKIERKALIDQGYTDLPKDVQKFWFQRVWDETHETWYVPWPATPAADGKPRVPVVDKARTVEHGLGFVPLVWMRNLPGGDAIDGACTFKPAIDNTIEADYIASQAGRGLKYSADPTLMIRDPAGQANLTGGAATALVLADDGDAKLLEISGSASEAVLGYVGHLRKISFDRIGGDGSDPDKMSTAQSGRAMELMKQGLVWLADKLRASYGDGGILPLLRMVCAASAKMNGGIYCGDKRVSGLNPAGLSLKWPHFFAPTYDDLNQQAQTLSSLTTSALMSRKSAVGVVAESYDIPDVGAEVAEIATDEANETTLLADRAAQTQAKENANS